MRIGLFNPYLDTLGGGERYMLTAASCFSDKHTVDVFWDDASILKRASERFGIDLSHIRVVPNFFSPKIPIVQRLFATRTYDCIIFLSDGNLPLTLAKKLIVHFQFPVEWVKADDIFTRLKLARINHVICNSRFTKRFIDKKFNITSTVLYPPVDVRSDPSSSLRAGKLEVRSSDKENLILTVGRFGRLPEGRNFKKQDVMIEVFKDMVDNGLKDWELVVAVSFRQKDSDEVDSLDQLAKGYPITIVKNLPSKKLASFYEKASIYWHAAGFGEDLVKYPERAEHFGIATVEAMAKGAVPVVFGAGGQLEIVDDNKNGFSWNTTEELIERTRMLMGDRRLWTRLSDRARKRAVVFSKERFCQELMRIVQ